MSKTKIILDCDPGYDDAIAIILASKSEKIDLLGITTTSGNTTIENTTKNALNIVQYLGLNIPVYKGQDRPLVKNPEESGKVHGESGLDGMNFPKFENEKNIENKKAVNFIIETCLNNPKNITIVATGPLTNIALAIRLEPKIISCINEIISMGGAYGVGNVNSSSEFNIFYDPEAAQIVYSSGIKIKMIGLDITLKVILNKDVIERIKKINNKASNLFCTCAENYNEIRYKLFGGEKYGPLHDPITVAILINDKIVKFYEKDIQIDLSHGLSYGRTWSSNKKINKQNAEVGLEIDVDEFWNVVENEVKKY